MSELDEAVARLAALPPPTPDPRDAEIERMESALRLISTGNPAAAGNATAMSFEEWARLVAQNALNIHKRREAE